MDQRGELIHSQGELSEYTAHVNFAEVQASLKKRSNEINSADFPATHHATVSADPEGGTIHTYFQIGKAEEYAFYLFEGDRRLSAVHVLRKFVGDREPQREFVLLYDYLQKKFVMQGEKKGERYEEWGKEMKQLKDPPQPPVQLPSTSEGPPPIPVPA